MARLPTDGPEDIPPELEADLAVIKSVMEGVTEGFPDGWAHIGMFAKLGGQASIHVSNIDLGHAIQVAELILGRMKEELARDQPPKPPRIIVPGPGFRPGDEIKN